MLAAPGVVRHALALPEVGAGAEAGPLAGEHQARCHAGIDIEAGETVAQLLHHARVHGIADLGPAHRDRAHPIIAECDLQCLVAHRFSGAAPIKSLIITQRPEGASVTSTRHPPAGNRRRGATGTRVPYRQPRSLAAPGGRETSSGPLRVLRDLAVPGVALRHPRAAICVPLQALASRSPNESFTVGLEPCGRSPARRPLLVLCRKRSQRASWTSSHLALLPGAGRLHVKDGCAFHVPSQQATRASSHGADRAGISAPGEAGAYSCAHGKRPPWPVPGETK